MVMKSLFYKLIIFLFSLGAFLAETNQSAGQLISLKSGSVIEKRVLRGKPQEVKVTDPRGKMQWQQSLDGVTWLIWSGKTETSVVVVVNEKIFLRCAIQQDNCDRVYSDVLKLIPIELATVNTNAITEIRKESAVGGGNIINNGGDTIQQKGVCWSLNQFPTITDNKTLDGTGIGSYSSALTGLMPETTYYVRAYATNSAGTAYGNKVDFTTAHNITLPSVITGNITNITYSTAEGGGNVFHDGYSTVTARGLCWSVSQHPTVTDNKTTEGIGTGMFTSRLTNLIANTTYQVRAYATNSFGTIYGSEIVFTTRPKNVLVTDGDSRTCGWNCSYEYPYWPLLSLDKSFIISNTAVGGLSTTDLVSKAEEEVDPKLSVLSRFNIVVCWAGVNDILVHNSPAGTVYDNLVSYCTERKEKGWKVIVCTEVSMRGIGPIGVCDSLRMALNDSLRANWVDFADGIADLGAHKSIGYLGAFKDTTFFCDGVHLTNAGTFCVAEVISKSINDLINSELK